MGRFLLFILLTIFSLGSLYSQENPHIDKKAFFTASDGALVAKSNLKIAEKYYRKGRGTFDEALKYYLKVYQYNDSSVVLNYKIGVCYLWTSNKKAALSYFQKSSADVAGDYFLALGRAYQYNLMFDEAKEAYSNYLNSLKPWEQKDATKLYSQLVSECEVGKVILADSISAFIINMGPIVNSYYDDYGAVLNPDESLLYFTSKRPLEEPNKKVSRYKFKERILQANNNAIDLPADYVDGLLKIDFNVNTSVSGFDKEEQKIYFFKGKMHNGRLFSAVLKEGKWTKRKPLKGGVNHMVYKETSISIDSKGNAYFITDRKGGLGGKDIWKAAPKKKNKFDKPINLGPILNTPYDEEGVYIVPEGNVLYFSSKGRKGMGGFDVYKSTLGEDSVWTEPVNLGYPINSTADELFYKPTKDTMVAIYSTVRGDSYGGLDLYKIQLDPRKPFKLLGSVIDNETGKTLLANISVYDKSSQKLILSAAVDSLTETYFMNFEDVGDYFIIVEFEGYQTITQDFICPDIKNTVVVKDFAIEALKHPFTLFGKVADIDKGFPLKASLIFRLAAQPDSIIGRTNSIASTGKYNITFADKYNMIIQVDAKDYFSLDEALSVESEVNSVLTKNIELKRSKIEYTLMGRVLDEEGKIPVIAALSFFRADQLEPFSILVSDSVEGKYVLLTEEKGPFNIIVEANGYFYMNETYEFLDGDTITSKDFVIKKMETGVKIVMKNILFNSGKATLKPDSYAELDKLVDLLIKNKNVRIEVSGHTDNIGSASVNKRISKERALTVKNYLVSRGLEQSRIEFAGYGFDQPIAPNDSAEGRAKNRRVELKILN